MASKFFACLFFLRVLSDPTTLDDLASAYDRSMMGITIDQASELSSSMALIQKNTQALLGMITNIKIQLQTNNNEKVEEIDKQFESFLRQKDSLGMQLAQSQIDYPFDRMVDEEIFDDLSEDYDFIQSELKSISDKNEVIDHLNEVELECQDLLTRLSTHQNTLLISYSDFFSGFDKSTNPDRSSIIASDQLPVYGSTSDNLVDQGPTCIGSGDMSIEAYSPSWSNITKHGTISAGTWTYPEGDMHLGIDIATNMYTEIYAPANGLILYADAPVSSDDGYLGHMVGWPAGGGNTIAMVCAVNGRLYGVTFAHLSQDIRVMASSQVKQGDVLALSGNSGNSTGPHTHVELFEFHVPLEEVVAYFSSSADFGFGCGFKAPATSSSIATRLRPETVWGN